MVGIITIIIMCVMGAFVERCAEINSTPELVLFDHWWEVSSEHFVFLSCGMYDVKKKIKIGGFKLYFVFFNIWLNGSND